MKTLLSALCLFLLSAPAVFASTDGHAAHDAVSAALPVWSIIPFVGMLLSIAIFPLVKPEWWEKNMLWVALAWSAVFVIPFAVAYGPGEALYRLLESVLLDYVPFIVLLLGLFAVAGGIALKGTLVGTTKVNVILLLIGTVLASWIGTTGAAMLLIRPVIRANAWRKESPHYRILHFPRGQYGRMSDTAGRSSAVHGIPERYFLHMDVPSAADSAVQYGNPLCGIRFDRPLFL